MTPRDDNQTSVTRPVLGEGVPLAMQALGRTESAAFQRWVRLGSGVTAFAYAAFSVMGYWLELPTSNPYTQGVTAIVCLVAFLMAGRGRIELAATLTIAAVWFEVHVEVFQEGLFSPSILILPPLIACAGLLVGGRAGYALAILTAIASPIADALGHVATGVPREDPGFDLYITTLLVVLMLVVAALVDLAMKALGRVIDKAVANERRVSDLIRFSPDGIVSVSADGAVHSANPSAERMLGATEKELAGEALSDVIRERMPDGVPAGVLESLLEPGGGATLLELHPGLGPATHLEATTTRFRTPEGTSVTQLTLHDATERVAAQQMERDMQTRLEESNRLDAVGRLAGGIAHEFNNNLTVIGGFAELLMADENEEEVRELAGGILDMQQRASTVTRRLLAFARRDVVRPTRTFLSDVVDEIRPLLRTVGGKGIELYTRCETTPPVMADPQQVEHLLVNLLANAKDAQRGSGRATVSVVPPAGESRGQVGEMRLVPFGFVELRIDDPGPGMDAESVSRAFEPFYTGGPFGEAAGMGLATVHGIVAQNGGRVFLESELGVGTTVRIHWPVAPEE